MRKRPGCNKRSGNDTRAAAEEILDLMLDQARRQFDDTVKSFWFYDGDLCPGCLARPIGVVKIKAKDGLPVNAFIYCPRSVLIGYFLCH